MSALRRWDYRLMVAAEGPVHLREVYYADDGSVEAWTAEPAVASGNDEAEVREDFAAMSEAFDRPVLVESALKRRLKTEQYS